MRWPSNLSSLTRAIFEQLHHLRRARGANRHDSGNNLRVEGSRGAAAGRVCAANDFRDLREAELLVARIFAFGREGEEKIRGDIFRFRSARDGAFQPASLEDRQHEFLGRPRIRRAFKHDQLGSLEIG